eukprot:m.154269 g.154269  ORF g.154269 m.154269 type:complete len:411 (+) comp15126_c0_seq5:122-1354(+)
MVTRRASRSVPVILRTLRPYSFKVNPLGFHLSAERCLPHTAARSLASFPTRSTSVTGYLASQTSAAPIPRHFYFLQKEFSSKSSKSQMASGNLQAQKEEIEVLESIYGPEWAAVNPQTGEYVISINTLWTLVVLLPESYPSTDAPVFELRGPASFDSEAKDEVAVRLQEMFQEQIGTPTLFQWIEYLREHLSATEETLAGPAGNDDLTHAESEEHEGMEDHWEDEYDEGEGAELRQEPVHESDEEKLPDKMDWRDVRVYVCVYVRRIDNADSDHSCKGIRVTSASSCSATELVTAAEKRLRVATTRFITQWLTESVTHLCTQLLTCSTTGLAARRATWVLDWTGSTSVRAGTIRRCNAASLLVLTTTRCRREALTWSTARSCTRFKLCTRTSATRLVAWLAAWGSTLLLR